jgi:hypothetical protein
MGQSYASKASENGETSGGRRLFSTRPAETSLGACRLKPRHVVPEWDFMQKRFYWAMAAYGVLALMAEFTLDGKFRIGVWILLAGLAVKTCIAYKTSNL